MAYFGRTIIFFWNKCSTASKIRIYLVSFEENLPKSWLLFITDKKKSRLWLLIQASFKFAMPWGEKVAPILSRFSSRWQATPELKITLIPVSTFTDNKMASKRKMMLTSKILNIKSPLLQVVNDFVVLNVSYQNNKNNEQIIKTKVSCFINNLDFFVSRLRSILYAQDARAYGIQMKVIAS